MFHAKFPQMRFFHHDKFPAFITLGDERVFLQSKFCQSCSFATRDIWLDRELALVYQVLHVHLESLDGFSVERFLRGGSFLLAVKGQVLLAKVLLFNVVPLVWFDPPEVP